MKDEKKDDWEYDDEFAGGNIFYYELKKWSMFSELFLFHAVLHNWNTLTSDQPLNRMPSRKEKLMFKNGKPIYI